MSDAKKCDRCEALYEVQTGCVSLDVSVASPPTHSVPDEADRSWQGWEDVDFCPPCSKLILEVIRAALAGLKL